MILAACEKAVQHVYEHRLRPEEKQHQPWIARVTGQLLAACREWDARLADRAAAAQPDQVMVTSTVVWSFIQLMIPAVVSAAAFPHIRALAEKGRRCRRFNSIRWVNGRGVGLQPDEDVIARLGCAQRLASVTACCRDCHRCTSR